MPDRPRSLPALRANHLNDRSRGEGDITRPGGCGQSSRGPRVPMTTSSAAVPSGAGSPLLKAGASVLLGASGSATDN